MRGGAEGTGASLSTSDSEVGGGGRERSGMGGGEGEGDGRGEGEGDAECKTTVGLKRLPVCQTLQEKNTHKSTEISKHNTMHIAKH